MILKVLFWFFLGIILYAYIGYTIVLLVIAAINRLFQFHRQHLQEHFLPEVTLLVPAYNEAGYVIRKVNNTLELDYPKEKLKIIWIIDGSTDDTYNLLCRYPEITVMHEKERRGKIHAMNRGMKKVNSPIVVFTDANTMLNKNALREITRQFADHKTGCVTGEKRISESEMQKAVAAGEGLYWRYESLIKRLESETGSVMGAVGEIFAIRTELYNEIKEDTLLDDFTISLMIARQGFWIKYAPHAVGTETASLSISEEIKRKIRIAIGGLQTLTRFTGLLNPFRNCFLTFKYISHKVLRWTIVPFAFPLVLLLNLIIVLTPFNTSLYSVLFLMQCIFYLFALAGRLLHEVRIKMKALFAPYYLVVMNYAIIAGFVRFIKGNYSVKWQKARRI